MGWVDETQLHEAYVAPEFPPGMPDDANARDVGSTVTGWRVRCECSTPTSLGPVSSWASDLLVRVPTPALENLATGRIYATDEEAGWIDSRLDVGDLAVKIWREQHLAIPSALDRIEKARYAADAAQRRLDEAVTAARTAGASWEAIGRVAGMTRQSAHQRWAGLDRVRP